jgi:hypothetical protein
MASPATTARRLPLIAIITGLIVAALATAAALYFWPSPKASSNTPASDEAKAYLRHLNLSNVAMQATENFMKQQVVEVTGTIGNSGPRSLRSVEVYCLFSDVSGREIYRERLPIVSVQQQPLRPGERRTFRLPFDALPDGWNQAMPRLVIAQIRFAQ